MKINTKQDFLPRTLRLWNELPAEVFPRIYNIGIFKKGVLRFLEGWQHAYYLQVAVAGIHTPCIISRHIWGIKKAATILYNILTNITLPLKITLRSTVYWMFFFSFNIVKSFTSFPFVCSGNKPTFKHDLHYSNRRHVNASKIGLGDGQLRFKGKVWPSNGRLSSMSIWSKWKTFVTFV